MIGWESLFIMKYRANSFEARIEKLLPADWELFSVTFHGLIREREGGWSVNDSWTPVSGVDREDAIRALRARWGVFKVSYLPNARVKNITDAGSGEDCLLEVDYTAFATVTQFKSE